MPQLNPFLKENLKTFKAALKKHKMNKSFYVHYYGTGDSGGIEDASPANWNDKDFADLIKDRLLSPKTFVTFKLKAFDDTPFRTQDFDFLNACNYLIEELSEAEGLYIDYNNDGCEGRLCFDIDSKNKWTYHFEHSKFYVETRNEDTDPVSF